MQNGRQQNPIISSLKAPYPILQIELPLVPGLADPVILADDNIGGIKELACSIISEKLKIATKM